MSKLGFRCSNCDNPVQVDPDQAGFVIYCPNCMAELIVPEATQLTPPPPPPPPLQDEPVRSPSQILHTFAGPQASAPPIAAAADVEWQPAPAVREDPNTDAVRSRPRHSATLTADVARTEVFNPQGLGAGAAPVEETEGELHAGSLAIVSPDHAMAHERRIPHSHAFAYTSDGLFQPFDSGELAAVIGREDPQLVIAVESVTRSPAAWPCAVFAALLEARIARTLGDLPPVQCPTVMFGNPVKFAGLLRDRYLAFLSLMKQLYPAFGDGFQYALTHYDLERFVQCADLVREPLSGIQNFMTELQRLALPRKEALLECRAMMLGWHDELTERLKDLGDRLRARAALTPEQAQMSTINVALMPASLPRFIARLQTVLGEDAT